MTAPRTVTRLLHVRDPEGLHARPCAAVAREMQRFECDAVLLSKGQEASARSVLELLGLGVVAADELEIRATGEDAEACVEAIARILSESRSIDDGKSVVP